MAVPMSGQNRAKKQQKFTSRSVIYIFYESVIYYPLKNRSSIESLQGIIDIGKPATTENSNAILDDCIISTLSYYVAYKIFSLHS